MTKRNKFLCLLSASLLVAGCGNQNTSTTPESEDTKSQEETSKEESKSIEESSSESSSKETSSSQAKIDVELPTDIPNYGEESVQIHYHRSDGKYAPWSLWLWSGALAGSQHMFNYSDSTGVVASYTLSELAINPELDQLGFIVAKNPGTTWDGKDTDSDRFIDFTTIDKDDNGVYHVYIFSGDANVYASYEKELIDGITSCIFRDEKTITVSTLTAVSAYTLYEDDKVIETNDAAGGVRSVRINLPEGQFAFDKNYKVSVTFKESQKTLESVVSIQRLLASASFNDTYYYDGNDLGATFTDTTTTFKVWAPTSSKVVLKVYENGTPVAVDGKKGSDTVYKEVEMTKGKKGVFAATIDENLAGKYYTYTVTNGSYTNREVVDPYAKSTGVNGLRGMVVDFSKTNPEGWDSISPLAIDRKHLTVWETHVADVTSSSTWTGTEVYRKKFLGLIESGTTYTNNGVTVKTGFDHIKELGVNAVQLIPVFDQANDEINTEFNWGYNPLNYNTIEGCYSTNPYDGYNRIREFKEVIKAFNEAGINIIMDVVYNHVNGAIGSNWDVLVPGYYYRYTSAGKLSNGSGCGNEVASENPMVRKFIVESTSFLASEYKLGGFRFDLMGLHDLTTMEEVSKACSEINPSICIYGEPWTGGTTTLATGSQAAQVNTNSYKGYGAFNDKIRDAMIKGGLAGKEEKGWVDNTTTAMGTTDINQLMNGIKGIADTGVLKFTDPDKTVTYATCHDNYTLHDRFVAAGIKDEDAIKKMAMLANSVVLTSQGTAFILAGEEMLRTKQGNSNSYNASYEVNELNYQWKIDNMDMFDNYKKLIALKQNVDGLALDKDHNSFLVMNKDDNAVITYTITDTTNNVEYMIIHANGYNVDNRSSINLEGYSLYLDTLGKLEGELGTVTPEAYQTIIAYKNL